MSNDHKKNVLFCFEEDELLELRKILFRKGLSVQEFFVHVMHRCVMQDNEVETFYDGTQAMKEAVMLKGDKTEEIKLGDVDTLYHMIEQSLKK